MTDALHELAPPSPVISALASSISSLDEEPARGCVTSPRAPPRWRRGCPGRPSAMAPADTASVSGRVLGMRQLIGSARFRIEGGDEAAGEGGAGQRSRGARRAPRRSARRSAERRCRAPRSPWPDEAAPDDRRRLLWRRQRRSSARGGRRSLGRVFPEDPPVNQGRDARGGDGGQRAHAGQEARPDEALVRDRSAWRDASYATHRGRYSRRVPATRPHPRLGPGDRRPGALADRSGPQPAAHGPPRRHGGRHPSRGRARDPPLRRAPARPRPACGARGVRAGDRGGAPGPAVPARAAVRRRLAAGAVPASPEDRAAPAPRARASAARGRRGRHGQGPPRPRGRRRRPGLPAHDALRPRDRRAGRRGAAGVPGGAQATAVRAGVGGPHPAAGGHRGATTLRRSRRPSRGWGSPSSCRSA